MSAVFRTHDGAGWVVASRRAWDGGAWVGTGVPPDLNPLPPTEDTTPYAMPTAAPWNAPQYAITPTPDGTGSAVHPGVVDFGSAGWRGWRYWMAVTPYYMSNDQEENPCILHSNDGYAWSVPEGLVNPIAPSPAGTAYNSDTDLAYNPEADELVCMWRQSGEILNISTSADGSMWSPKATAMQGPGLVLSPCMIRVGANQWRLYTVGSTAAGTNVDGAMTVRTASSPSGPWGDPQDAMLPAYPDGQSLWHLGVTLHEGVYYAALNARGGTSGWGIWAATSADGITWSMDPVRVLGNRSSWDSSALYRAVIQPHENGTHFRVWYSSAGPSSWRVGYTQIPRSYWTALV